MPTIPKPPNQRRRTNKSTSAATLKAVPAGSEAPDLPFEAHALTVAWWSDIWSSPMAPEWDGSDLHGVYVLARIVDEFWKAEKSTDMARLSGEIRLHSQRFGLSPIDRRRLQWEIERGESAETKRARRESAKGKRADPRMKVVGS